MDPKERTYRGCSGDPEIEALDFHYRIPRFRRRHLYVKLLHVWDVVASSTHVVFRVGVVVPLFRQKVGLLQVYVPLSVQGARVLFELLQPTSGRGSFPRHG